MSNKGMFVVGMAVAVLGFVPLAFVLLAKPITAVLQDRRAQRVAHCMREHTALPDLESNGRYVDGEAAAVQAIAQCPD